MNCGLQNCEIINCCFKFPICTLSLKDKAHTYYCYTWHLTMAGGWHVRLTGTAGRQSVKLLTELAPQMGTNKEVFCQGLQRLMLPRVITSPMLFLKATVCTVCQHCKWNAFIALPQTHHKRQVQRASGRWQIPYSIRLHKHALFQLQYARLKCL